MTLSLGALRKRRGCGFESRHPRHLSLMLYKLALSEPGCISGKFVGNLSYRLGKVCPSLANNRKGGNVAHGLLHFRSPQWLTAQRVVESPARQRHHTQQRQNGRRHVPR